MGTSMQFLSVVAKSCLNTFATPQTVALEAPLSMGFPRQESWSGLPFPSLGSLPDLGIETVSPALAGRFFTTAPPGKANAWSTGSQKCAT